jgi:hypothetical protein
MHFVRLVVRRVDSRMTLWWRVAEGIFDLLDHVDDGDQSELSDGTDELCSYCYRSALGQ